MCTNPTYILVEPTPYERIKGVVSPYCIPAPCGKCCECLARRQNSFMYRAYKEAKKYGNMYHLTLSYSETCVPMARSLWKCWHDTGELVKVRDAEAIHKKKTVVGTYSISRFDHRFKHKFVRLKPRVVNYYAWRADSPLRVKVIAAPQRGSIPSLQSKPLEDFGFAKDFNYQYFETRSYDTKDFQSFLKYCKTEFGRRYFNVENLRYLVSPEYGERKTRRPHLHCILINCPEQFAQFLADVWSKGYQKKFKNGNVKTYFGYGRATLQHVNLKCKKYKGDGFKNVACYVSKYTCKGFLDNPCALQGFTAKMRVLTSKGFGDILSESERRHYLALDKFEYDPEDLRGLPQLTIQQIVDTIINRLFFTLPGVVDKNGNSIKFPLPNRILKSVFRFRLCKSGQDFPRYLKEGRYPIDCTTPKNGKSIWSAISYEVKNTLRNRFIQDNEDKLKSFISQFGSEYLSKAVAEFNRFQRAAASAREENKKQYLLKQLKYATI